MLHCIIRHSVNLLCALRNRTENKILVGIMPGPHEANVHSIHGFLEPLVDDLLRLWNTGIQLDRDGELTSDISVA
jgi:hypothetical protein